MRVPLTIMTVLLGALLTVTGYYVRTVVQLGERVAKIEGHLGIAAVTHRGIVNARGLPGSLGSNAAAASTATSTSGTDAEARATAETPR